MRLLEKYKDNTKAKIIALIVGLCIIGAIGVFSYLSIQNAPVDKDNQNIVTINIEENSSTWNIADILIDEGLIKNRNAFRITSKLLGYDEKYLAGYYQLSPSMTSIQMMKAIVEGDVVNIAFTVVPGDRLEDIAANLEAQGICSAKEFIDETVKGQFDYKFMTYLPKGEKRMEGVLFPETYSFPIGVKVHTIVDCMLEQFDKNIKPEYYKKAKKLGYNFYDVIKVASIVEREAKLDEERPLVASVIYNRLKKGMKLQMCSSVSYLLDDGRVNLTNADIAIDSPYNTYKHEGLTPTPIGSAGSASIEAAFNPKKTKYLYFVLSEKLDGSSNFSEDFATFERDKERYYKAYEKENE